MSLFQRTLWVQTLLAATVTLIPLPALAQFKHEVPPEGEVTFGQEKIYHYKAGVRIKAAGPCEGVFGTMPIPVSWPEQEVSILQEDLSPQVEVKWLNVSPTVTHMQVTAPSLAAGEEAYAIVTFQVVVREQLPPTATEQYVIPKKPPRSIKMYLAKSPLIEVNHSKIKQTLQTVLDELKEKDSALADNPWKQAEALYDWTRSNIKYVDSPLKGAVAALKDGTGDCEELTSLFVALCRTNKIPARTVWVPGHCYPEFYLEDAEGKGRWFPCQAAGDRAFGGLMERPILQKGDSFKLPWQDKPVRYASEHLSIKHADGKPEIKFVREIINNPAAGT